MTSEERIISEIQTLSSEGSFQLDTAQIRAKAVLKELTGKIPDYSWSYSAGTVIRNISAALFNLETIAIRNPTDLEKVRLPARQFALIWESLARLEERTKKSSALINAATAYEIAGYQANAACLARIISPPENAKGPLSVQELCSLFLQRLFLRVRTSYELIPEPQECTLSVDILSSIGDTLASYGFKNASTYMLNGSEALLAEAIKNFADSEKVFSDCSLVEQSIMLHHIRSLLPIINQRSTWVMLRDILKGNLRWHRYLRLLSRGIGKDLINCPSISELWPSQIEALKDGLLSPDESKIVKMPTSAGKTRVAELAIAHTLIAQPGSKCVYIAPYRALVSELEDSFLNLFGDLGYFVSSVLGSYESNEFEESIEANADIIVMTPEKLDLLQRAQPEFLDNVRLIVLDEGQIVQEKTRGVKFELLLTRLMRRLPHARFLFLSAVVPDETLQDFAAWFNSNPEKGIIKTDWRPSILRVAKFEWQGFTGVIRYAPEEDIPLLKTFVSGIIESRPFVFTNKKSGRINHKIFPSTLSKGETAAELAYRLSRLGPVLVFCSEPSYTLSVAKALQTRLDYAEQVGESIPDYFTCCSSTDSVICAEAWLGKFHEVTSFLKKGIAIHHGRLPDAVKKAVEEDFRNRNYRVLIATNTLAQGVNLPIKTVIVHSCWRQRIGELPERISARDYWNIAGRAGRAGRETEGTIIHLVMDRKDERDYNQYLNSRNKVEHVQSALFTLLIETVVQRLSPAALSEILDPEVLALLVEEKVDTLTKEKIQELLSKSLFQTQVNRIPNFPTEILVEAFENASSEIKKRIPDSGYWPVYSSTGLSSMSCKILEEFILANKEPITLLLTNSNEGSIPELIKYSLAACSDLPEMQFSKAFRGSYEKLLQAWICGTDIDEIVESFMQDAASPEALANIIEQIFSFRLPWGLMGLLRIASKILEIDNSKFSIYAKYFPTMVKFGVPSPFATWALSSGVHLRNNAILIGERYLKQTACPSLDGFQKWLGSLHSEDLRNEYGFDNNSVEDINKAISRSGTNELLKEYSSAEEALPFETSVKGISYENRREVAKNAKIGQIVRIVREYKNKFDHNAIKVLLGNEELGFVERDLAQLIAPDVDCGLSLKGTITRIVSGETPIVTIKLEMVH